MKTLLIMRHATPEAAGPDGTDASRPLAPLGEKEAQLQGAFLREAEIRPQLVAASSAVRTQTTANLVAGMIPDGPPVTPEEALYDAAGDELLEYLRGLPESVESVLLVAHMPGVAELLAILAGGHAGVAVHFKPCTMANVSLNGIRNWADLQPGAGMLEWLLPPIGVK